MKGTATFDAVINDPDVAEAMANSKERYRPSPPSWFGWTPMYEAVRDIQDQLIALRGGDRFVPRPKVPGLEARIRRMDSDLRALVDRVTVN